MVAVNSLRGSAIIDAIKASGVEFIVALPDLTTSDGLLWPIDRDSELKLVRVSKEDEGISICAGLAYCDKRSLLLMQNTGLLDSINAIRGIAVEYELPICMMVGLLAKEPGVKPTESSQYGVRIVEPILDVMGVQHQLVEEAADVMKIRPAIDRAYETSRPSALLIGRRPEP